MRRIQGLQIIIQYHLRIFFIARLYIPGKSFVTFSDAASPGYNGAPGVVSPRTNLVSFIFLPRYYSQPAPFLPDFQYIIVAVYLIIYCPTY